MKKLAVVVSGWHFPHLFFKQLAEQEVPEGWEVDFFCVSHRHPRYAVEEKANFLDSLGSSYRELMDRLLYAKVAMPEDIEALGWNYKEYPNTVGDMGNMNQWLEEHDYRAYDMFLISHDDNYIPTKRIFVDLVAPASDWLILTNSKGSVLSLRDKIKNWNKSITIRGSFEIMKREVFDMLGGTFDLSDVTLTREGETSADRDTDTLKDWNNTVRPLKDIFDKKGMVKKIHPLSKYYRVSEYCIEGERGYVSLSQKENRVEEDAGFAWLQKKFDAELLST